MENYREVTVLDNSGNKNSSAREKYRYLNSSHRNSRGDRQTYRTSERENYYSGHTSTSQNEGVDEEKIAREFRRLMISTAIVGVAVFVKVLDFGVANAIEDRFRSSLQTTSQIDNKISDSMVSFGQKVGINLDEINNNSNLATDINTNINTDNTDNTVIDDSFINTDTNANSTDVIGEINNNVNNITDVTNSDSTAADSTDNGVDIANEQISDFYIDDEILESVFEDGKK